MTDVSNKETCSYKKLYFLWYFDDAEGFGIEVMGEPEANRLQKSKFDCLITWSFGFGTEARDMRRAWGDYVAMQSQQNHGQIPVELVGIELRYRPGEGLQGDLESVRQLLSRQANNGA